MKKIAFIVVISMILMLNFGISSAPSYAANISSESSTLSPEESKILNSQLEMLKSRLLELQSQQAQQAQEAQQTQEAQEITAKPAVSISSENITALKEGLTALTVVLTDLQTRLKNNDLTLEQRNAVNIALSNITTNLVAITSSLGSQNLAITEEKIASQPSSISNKNDLANAQAGLESQISKKENEQVASLGIIANLKNLPLPAIIISLIVAAGIFIWFFMIRTTKNQKTEASKA